jgi:hypothetical protein
VSHNNHPDCSSAHRDRRRWRPWGRTGPRQPRTSAIGGGETAVAPWGKPSELRRTATRMSVNEVPGFRYFSRCQNKVGENQHTRQAIGCELSPARNFVHRLARNAPEVHWAESRTENERLYKDSVKPQREYHGAPKKKQQQDGVGGGGGFPTGLRTTARWDCGTGCPRE